MQIHEALDCVQCHSMLHVHVHIHVCTCTDSLFILCRYCMVAVSPALCHFLLQLQQYESIRLWWSFFILSLNVTRSYECNSILQEPHTLVRNLFLLITSLVGSSAQPIAIPALNMHFCTPHPQIYTYMYNVLNPLYQCAQNLY